MAHAEQHGSEHGHHIIPKSLLFKVFGALVVLTILTVAVAQVDLGPLNIPVALAVAGAKASLVVTFFMALKYDKKVNTLVFSIGVLFVVVFLTFTLFDTAFRGALGIFDPQTIAEQERAMEQMRQRDPGAAGLRITPADSAAMAADTTGAAAAQEDTTAAGSEDQAAGGGAQP